MNIVTGYKGEAHITSAQDRAVNQGSYGTGYYILAIGQRLAAEAVSATEVRIKDGALAMEGCVAVIETGDYESLSIQNGSQGMLRTDLIVAKYTRTAGTNVESIELLVKTGTPATSNPATPSYTSGSIQEGDSPVEMPLYRVNISGITIASITQVAELCWTQKGLKDKMGTASLATTATNLSAAINEHEGDINTLKGRTINGNSLGSGNITLTYSDVGAAPTSHTSTATTSPYGGANQTTWGHARVINALTQDSHVAGYALSAYQGYLLNNKITSLIQSSRAIAPTSTEAAAGDPELYVRYNGTAISHANTPNTSYLVLVQSSTAGDGMSALYAVSIDSDATSAYLVGGSETIHKMYVGGTNGTLYIRTLNKSSGWYAVVTVIKTR